MLKLFLGVFIARVLNPKLTVDELFCGAPADPERSHDDGWGTPCRTAGSPSLLISKCGLSKRRFTVMLHHLWKVWAVPVEEDEWVLRPFLDAIDEQARSQVVGGNMYCLDEIMSVYRRWGEHQHQQQQQLRPQEPLGPLV